MSNPYRYPEVGHVFRHCLVCGRPFRVCKSRLLRPGAKFCTQQCYFAAWRAFSEALASDRLGLILQDKSASSEPLKAKAVLGSWSGYGG